ncbi:MAG: site-specific integrase, partial [Magnetococcales bacterium]|nr:site-specific integrase [Magnetococcales bacterium]
EDERLRLLEACESSQCSALYPIVVLALSTGGRKSEITGISWGDVDLRRGMVTLHDTKNGDRRSLTLASHALMVIKKLSKVRRIDTELLFPSDRYPSKPINFRHAWNKALEVSEVEDFHFHDLRHSAASYLAMNGATLAEIAKILGHKTLQMVMRYAHLSEDHTAGVVTKMNEKIFG